MIPIVSVRAVKLYITYALVYNQPKLFCVDYKLKRND